ncbi:MAG: calcium-binding protein [Candidatus Nitrosopolaris sp.]
MNEIRSKQEERIAKKGERNETSNVKLCFKSDPEIIGLYQNKAYPLMAVEGLEYLKRELEKIADEATTDCYNEYEQIAGWCAYLEDEIELPCKCKVGQKEGLLIGFDTNKDGSSLLAVVKIDMNEYKVAAETISILDERTSKYLEAFKEWL